MEERRERWLVAESISQAELNLRHRGRFGDATNFPNGGFPLGRTRTRGIPRPSSPWQPDQFANRRQPRLTYRVFLGLFFSYLPSYSSSSISSSFSYFSSFSTVLQPFFVSPLHSLCLVYFCWFRLEIRERQQEQKKKKGIGKSIHFLAFCLIPFSLLRLWLFSSSSLYKCVFSYIIKKIDMYRGMGATLILPTIDTTPSARLIRTWRL